MNAKEMREYAQAAQAGHPMEDDNGPWCYHCRDTWPCEPRRLADMVLELLPLVKAGNEWQLVAHEELHCQIEGSPWEGMEPEDCTHPGCVAWRHLREELNRE